MSDEREQLLARLEELDHAELDKEAARLKARLHEIGSAASQIVVALNENPKQAEELGRSAANLAEEAAQHGIRLTQILKGA